MILILNSNKIISVWYSDLGAVKMSQVELRHFPSNVWTTNEIVPELEDAESLFHSALRYDPDNVTANYRLGMIYLLQQDFESASANLETAYEQLPEHRGVIKNLGYDYVWLGRLDQAKDLLEQIPEAQEELNVYAWWWNTQGRSDLSANSSMLISRLTNN
jgi:tetratricopeptide (TPR) repeat protein